MSVSLVLAGKAGDDRYMPDDRRGLEHKHPLYQGREYSPDLQPPASKARYNSSVRKVAVVSCLCLLLSACTYQEVNEYSLFKYRSNDDLGMATLKTVGNVLPWTVEATAMGAVYGTVAAFYLGIAYLQSKQ